VRVKFVPELLKTALHHHGRSGHHRAIPASLDEPAELHQRGEVLFGPFPVLDLLQHGGEVNRPHPAWRALSATLDLEEVRVFQGRGHHAGGLVNYDDAGRSEPRTGLLQGLDRKSTRLNSSHVSISYAVFCLKKKNI